MCDVCNFEKINSLRLNGDKAGYTFENKVYVLNSSTVSTISLCYYHDIEFYLMGEARFIKKYPSVLRRIGVHREEVSFY